MFKKILGFLRLLAFALNMAFFIIIGAIGVFFQPRNKKAIYPFMQAWAHTSKWLMGIVVHKTGEPHHQHALYVPNHRSYIDIVLFPLEMFCSLVAKKSVASWPIIGAGAKIVNCVFVERDNPESRKRTREEVKRHLGEEHSIILFCEGTTSAGPGCLPFRPGMFHVAASAQIPVVPVAIEYREKEDAWVGDATFSPHFIKRFGKWKTHVYIRYGEVMIDTDGEALRNKSENWVNQNLLEMEKAIRA